MSLKLALDQLGYWPCHHMIEVIENSDRQVPLWNDALAGKPDFDAIYDGYAAAVDWPTAAFWKEVTDYYPEAKIILSTRSPESWYDSISQTILASLWAPDTWPPQAVAWFRMVEKVIERSLGDARQKDDLIAAYIAHDVAVKAAIPPERLLVHEASEAGNRSAPSSACRCRSSPIRAAIRRKNSSSTCARPTICSAVWRA